MPEPCRASLVGCPTPRLSGKGDKHKAIVFPGVFFHGWSPARPPAVGQVLQRQGWCLQASLYPTCVGGAPALATSKSSVMPSPGRGGEVLGVESLCGFTLRF